MFSHAIINYRETCSAVCHVTCLNEDKTHRCLSLSLLLVSMLLPILPILCAYVLSVQCCCTLWAIYSILTGYLSGIYDWLHIYTIYRKANVCTYLCTFTLTTTNNILFLLTKNKNNLYANACLLICLIQYA